MRTLIRIMLLPISLWAACTNHQTTNFIPGTYVNHAESAYSIADDTLVITAAPQNPDSYQVTRKTAFCRKVANQLQPPQHQIKSFTAIWDAAKQTLQLTQNGTIILFQPGNNTLKVENSEYRKL